MARLSGQGYGRDDGGDDDDDTGFDDSDFDVSLDTIDVTATDEPGSPGDGTSNTGGDTTGLDTGGDHSAGDAAAATDPYNAAAIAAFLQELFPENNPMNTLLGRLGLAPMQIDPNAYHGMPGFMPGPSQGRGSPFTENSNIFDPAYYDPSQVPGNFVDPAQPGVTTPGYGPGTTPGVGPGLDPGVTGPGVGPGTVDPGITTTGPGLTGPTVGGGPASDDFERLYRQLFGLDGGSSTQIEPVGPPLPAAQNLPGQDAPPAGVGDAQQQGAPVPDNAAETALAASGSPTVAAPALDQALRAMVMGVRRPARSGAF